MDNIQLRSRSDGLRLLSLDGGGIRGLSALLILDTIMHRIKAREKLESVPLPCDYFHLIGGTSSGGIIAIMLGRLRMSVDQAIGCYDALSGEVFKKARLFGRSKYSATTVERVIKNIVKDRTGDSEISLLDDGALGGICKTFVCAMSAHNLNAKKTVLFRTYHSPKDVEIPCTVWQAARATSATPTFFEHILIGPPTRREPFIDGGLGQNNPAEQVLSEAEVIFPGRQLLCLVSLGTGQPETIEVMTPNLIKKDVLVAMATDCEDTAERMAKHFKDRPKTYFRFNVDRGLRMVRLDAWDQRDKVSAHTRHYMAIHEVGTRLDEAVRAILGHGVGNPISTSDNIPNEPQVPDEDHGPVLHWISPINVFLKHSDVLRILHPGTGEWLVETDCFRSWVGGKGNALWLSGIPGAGKTVLASLAIEYLRNLQRKNLTRIGVAWVYFNYKEDSTQTPDAVLYSIVRQLTDSSADLYNHFKSVYKKNPHNRPLPSQLLANDILIRGFEKIFLVVDALDECADNSRDEFLKVMARLQVAGANILITSREHVYDHLTTSGLVNVQRIDIRAQPEDLAKYVEGCVQKQTRLSNIVRKDPLLRQDIVTTIVGSCDGMFLVARLQIESLRKHTNTASFRTSLRALPTTIHGFYDEAMHRIETDDRSEDALSVLSCLVYARRPLEVEELQHFLAIRPGLADLQEPHLTTRDTLISMCAGLVVVDDGAGIIRLVHLTTQEYFKQRREAWFPRGDEEMGRKCLAYLCLDAVRNFDWMIAFSSWDSPEVVKIHVLLDYIVEYWHFHVEPHQNTLREFLLSNPNFDVKNKYGRTLLIDASREGYESAVNFLLEHDADLNNRGGYQKSTALMYASRKGHSAVVKLLLKCGAQVDAKQEDGMTALMYASLEGHRTAVEFLLEHGAKVDAQEEDGMTALMFASSKGHMTVMQLLLERGAKVNAQDGDGTTALIWARRGGHSAVVQFLCEYERT